MRRTAHALALASLLLATACGADPAPKTADGPPAAAPPGPVDGGTGASLATPQDAALAFFASLEAAEFGAACQILSPGNLQAISRLGKDCQSYLSENLDAEARAEYAGLRIDASKIMTAGDTATIPAEAFSTPTDPGAGDDDVDLIRQGGVWLVVLGERSS